MQHKSYIKLICFSSIVLLLCNAPVSAQQDSSWLQQPVVSIEGYADVFYCYDFNKPETPYRQTFFYNHNRHNAFSLNHGYLKLAVSQPRYRASVALQTGTYVSDNYASEPDMLKGIYEAYAGLSLNTARTLWLDAGIMSSHIGFESALSIQNGTLTRSIAAENSPYYMAGMKLGWTPAPQWELNALVYNGWQHIQRIQGNSLPSFGTQVKYIPEKNVTLNYSTHVGSEFPDSVRRMRYFNNLFLQIQPGNHWGWIIGFDFGFQQRSKGSTEYDQWLSPVCIVKYTINEQWSAALRAEYYEDEKGVIIPVSADGGFKTGGISFNMDFMPLPNIAWRIEGRWLESKEAVFMKNQEPVRSNVFISTSLAVKFGTEIR